MKKVSLVVGMVFLCSAAAFAQSASGGFRFDTDSGTQTIEFSATTTNGRTSGSLSYSGTVDTPVLDVDGDGTREGGKFSPWVVKVDVDCMVTSGTRASMSGLIADASDRNVIGRRVIMAVEDNAGTKEPDRFNWGVYRNDKMGWIPADSELRFDEGWSLSWEATDYERKDDRPIPGRPPLNSDCTSFPLGAYTLDDIVSGDVVVR